MFTDKCPPTSMCQRAPHTWAAEWPLKRQQKSGSVTPPDDMKTDVAAETAPIYCEEEEEESRRAAPPEIEHFLPPFLFSFIQNLCISQPVSTNDNLSEALTTLTPRKDETNNICHSERDSKLKDTGNTLCWRFLCAILFLLCFPSSYPHEQGLFVEVGGW